MQIITFLKKSLPVLAVFFMQQFAGAQSRDGWYKVFTGKVGAYDATLHLHKTARNYSGYLWFQQVQVPMKIYYDEPNKKSDSLIVGAGNGPFNLLLSGILQGDHFNGTSEFTNFRTALKKEDFTLQVTETAFTPFSYFYTEGFAKLPPQFENQSDCNYVASTIWPAGNRSADSLYKNEVRQMFAIKKPVEEIGTWLIDEKNNFISNWRKTKTRLSPTETAGMGLSLSLHQELRVLVMFENAKYITLANYNSGYTGGAHEIYATNLSTLSKQYGKKLLLADIVTPAGIQALPRLLDEAARKQYNIKNTKPLDQNGFLAKRITAGQNFYVNDYGLGFIYAPYAIKSFAEGEINLLVPFSALKAYLKPAFAEETPAPVKKTVRRKS